MIAISAVAHGVASASMATTVLSYAFVGASGALTMSALMSIGDNFADQGEAAMWNTCASGGFGAIGCFISHKEQMSSLEHSWSTEAKRYWKSQGYDATPRGTDGESMVLHHPYGRYGSKIRIYEPMTRTNHTALHKQYGYGNGGFNGYINFSNAWDYMKRYFGG